MGGRSQRRLKQGEGEGSRCRGVESTMVVNRRRKERRTGVGRVARGEGDLHPGRDRRRRALVAERVERAALAGCYRLSFLHQLHQGRRRTACRGTLRSRTVQRHRTGGPGSRTGRARRCGRTCPSACCRKLPPSPRSETGSAERDGRHAL